MKILYINYVDFNNVSSGSSVRPKKMYEAFNNLGYEVTMLTGIQNKIKERWKNTKKFFRKIKNCDYDLCYVESPSGPIFNFCDHLILLYISKVKKIPVGFFYRDAYWKFGELGNISIIKKLVINLMHRFDWFIFKITCDKMYFPSKTMADLFNFKNKEAFPPGATIIKDEAKEFKNFKNCIYVGGVSERYGTEILLKAFELVNTKYNKNITLTLICRQEIDIIKKYKNSRWLSINTGISGDEMLKPFYEKADLAVIPFKRDVYMDFAIPIKLFEYLANQMPIVATDCIELSKFIKDNNIGIVTEDNGESLARGIVEFYDLKIEEKNSIYKNLNKSINMNTWEERAKKVTELIKYK